MLLNLFICVVLFKECAWLLKSPETFEYDLVNVQGDWTVWAGTFKSGGECE